jgi:para-aminobenzoate synthetase component 1
VTVAHPVPLALERDPLDVFARLAGEPGVLYLEVPDDDRPTVLLSCRPTAELRVDTATADPLAALAAFVADGPATDPRAPLPLGGGVVACLAYELGAAIAPRPVPHALDGPLAVLRRYDPLLVFDRRAAAWSLLAIDRRAASVPWLDRLAAPPAAWTGALAAPPLAATLSVERYRAAVRRILAYLAAGDCYQVNLTQPFTAPLAAPPSAVFQRLTRAHPAPYAAYVDLGDAAVVCNSPELLLRRRGRRVETRPIKGTRPRHPVAEHDASLAATLRRDAKELAEHLMIVDLERNDLGRVCVPGTVRVPRLIELDSHPSVHHLVSHVTGALEDGVDLAALLAAVFPGGSITGAPKLRAMEIIAELEPGPRGIYTGALGLIAPNGDCELALPIRTAVVRDGVLRWHAGGGIVIDSDPERELAEAWLKTQAIRAALGERIEEELGCSSG